MLATFIITLAGARAVVKVSGHQSGWLRPGNRIFLEVANMVVTLRIVAFVSSEIPGWSCVNTNCQL